MGPGGLHHHARKPFLLICRISKVRQEEADERCELQAEVSEASGTFAGEGEGCQRIEDKCFQSRFG